MRVPAEPVRAPVRSMRRYQVGLLVAIIAIIVLIILLQTSANFFTNYLWFRSVSATAVWRSMVETKLELAAVFCGVFFVACWTSLWIVDRIAPRALFMAPELELVRRYQQTLGRHRVAVRTVVSLLLCLAVGAGTNAQWQHWLLFIHGGKWGMTDPLFHRDVGWYVFKLPFISFLIDWGQLSLFLLLLVSAVAHYFNGGLRFSGPPPRVDPRTTAHLSAILAALALLRAVAYFYVDRYTLNLSTNGVVQGAGYTDVHVRLPALELLAVVALAAFVLFVYNVYYRSWLLPAVGFGLWALLALTVGVIFPAAVQWLQVNPSVSTLELPYIARNISATQYAMGISDVSAQPFTGTSKATAGDVLADQASFDNVALWDPQTAGQTLAVQQTYRNYYSILGTSIDRYLLGTTHKKLVPVIVGAREIQAGQLNRQTWVNTHLSFTHGYGVVMAQANEANSSGVLSTAIGGLPPAASPGSGAPVVKQPDIYFGPGMNGYVIANTKQPEVDYQTKGNNVQTSHYDADAGGGIKVGGFWTRLAFAVRFHDFNLLISHLVTSQSRIMFVQDIRSRVQKAAPFLQIDSNPYAIIDNGQIDWVVDGYTTTPYFPYGQPASNGMLSPSSGLGGSYNYVRNSVKAVVNAYTGKITFYAMDPNDPILRAWEAAFPGMFHPRSQMDATLRSHLRYPQDLLTVQAAMYGLYHVSSPSTFYGKENAWNIAQVGSGFSATASPLYELLTLPRQPNLSFDAIIPMQPASVTTNRAQSLTAFMVAQSASDHYGQLSAYEIPGGSNVPSLALVNSEIDSNSAVSSDITKLGLVNSRATFGPTFMVPVDSAIVWVRALFVTSRNNPVPTLREVIVYYNGTVEMRPTLLGKDGALSATFGSTVSNVGGSGGRKVTIPQQVQSLLRQAEADYAAAQADKSAGDFIGYYQESQAAGALVSEANSDLSKYESQHAKHDPGGSHPPSSTTTGASGTSGAGPPGGTSGSSGATGTSGAGSGAKSDDNA